MASLKLLLFLPLICLLPVTAIAGFKCSSNSTCNAIVDYKSPNATTLTHIADLFGVKQLASLLGINNLPATTAGNLTIAANETIKIPFPCLCRNGAGISDHRPIYTVVPNDGLSHIAVDVFSSLMTYQEIAAVNSIPDPNKIYVAQKLWIPLPCSCDEVGGEAVVHYGYVVPAGGSLSQIAKEYGADVPTLLSLNELAKASDLKADQVLDVPIKACTSNVGLGSPDYPLVVPNSTYVVTANNCVMCKCTAANNYTLQCQPSGLQAINNWSSCPSMKCSGPSSLSLGNSSSSSSSSCGNTTCAYAGYNHTAVITKLAQDPTCSANEASEARLQMWSLFLATLVSLLFIASSSPSF